MVNTKKMAVLAIMMTLLLSPIAYAASSIATSTATASNGGQATASSIATSSGDNDATAISEAIASENGVVEAKSVSGSEGETATDIVQKADTAGISETLNTVVNTEEVPVTVPEEESKAPCDSGCDDEPADTPCDSGCNEEPEDTPCNNGCDDEPDNTPCDNGCNDETEDTSCDSGCDGEPSCGSQSGEDASKLAATIKEDVQSIGTMTPTFENIKTDMKSFFEKYPRHSFERRLALEPDMQ